MRIKHHDSGSKGNAIQVDNVLIDAGVKTNDPFDILLITHAHIDHIRHLDHALINSKTFFTTDRVLTSIKEKMERWSNKKRNTTLALMKEKYQKPENVETFDLKHDVPCTGFLINNEYVHITDTGVTDLPESIKGKTFYTIESNYDEYELDTSGRPVELIDRIKETHLSNEQSIQMAKDLKATEVMFVHLSDETNHPDLAKATHDITHPEIKKHYPTQKQEILVERK